MRTLEESVAELIGWFESGTRYLIAFSGGIDSALLAAGAIKSGANCEAVFVQGPVSPRADLTEVDRFAEEIGIYLHRIDGPEMSDPLFLQNDPLRCYYCKKGRYESMLHFAEGRTLLDGSNADDRNDYRPGSNAVRELGIRSPLAELGIDKPTIRSLARFWGLSFAEKPSNPCLATRLAYGMTITKERLQRIDAAEDYLSRIGFPVHRVRMDTPDSARIEIDPTRLNELLAEPNRSELIDFFRRLGFQFISLDLEGFVSGKMNRNLSFNTQHNQSE